MPVWKLHKEMPVPARRGQLHDGKGLPDERMGRIEDGHVDRDLLRLGGLMIGTVTHATQAVSSGGWSASATTTRAR